MSELQVSTESLRKEAENTVLNIRKMKQVLEQQRSIIRKMGGYWKGEGYEAATNNYLTLSDKSSQLLDQLEDISAKFFDIALAYEETERANIEIVSQLPTSLLE
jgi:hypothetical protein